jgi:NAD(P)-dependent dehydrogenase (short-subunit alcohol dehydrogenase family)
LRLGERIVNFSSSVVGLALAGYAVYAATKSAIETLTNIFAKELRGREISVNAVAPGPTATDLLLEGKTPTVSSNSGHRYMKLFASRQSSSACSRSKVSARTPQR